MKKKIKPKQKTIKAWAVIDKETGEIEDLDNRPAIFREASEPMKKMENFIIHSGKVVPVSITFLTKNGKENI